MLSRRHFCSIVWPFVVVHRLIVVAVINNRNNNHRTANISRCVCPRVHHTALLSTVKSTTVARRNGLVCTDFASIVEISHRKIPEFMMRLLDAKVRFRQRRCNDMCTRATPKYLVMFPIFVYLRICIRLCVYDACVCVCVCVYACVAECRYLCVRKSRGMSGL